MAQLSRPHHRKDFEIALICALRVERDAVEALLDEDYEIDGFSYGKALGDHNAYTIGRMGNQHVVLAYMSGMGKASSAAVASSIRTSFEGIKVGILVGICGGVPKTADGAEILLGDVIIGETVIQIDFGRRYLNKFMRRDTPEDNLGRANPEIRSFLGKVSGRLVRQRLKEKTASYSAELCKKNGFQKFAYPGAGNDKLYPPRYQHKHHDPNSCDICAKCQNQDNSVCKTALNSTCTALGCDDRLLIHRDRVQKAKGLKSDGSAITDTAEVLEAQKASILFGRIASGDGVMKSGQHRDEIAADEKVIAFEMEGAGAWDYLPTVVIKSVCDYADSHKNKEWQGYAAATAAACTKALLEEWRSTEKPLERSVHAGENVGYRWHDATSIPIPSENLLKLLSAATQAASSSSTKRDDPLCLQGTRVDVLHHIMTWALARTIACEYDKDIVDKVSERSRQVDAYASATMNAEIHDLCAGILQMKESTATAQRQIQLDIQSQNRDYCDHQRSEALSILSKYSDSDPNATLEINRSLLRRRKAHQFAYQRRYGSPWPISLSRQLRDWASDRQCSLILIRSSSFVAPSRDLAIDIIDLVREANFHVIWVLPSVTNKQLSAPEFWRILLLQVAKINPESFASKRFPVTMTHFQNATTSEEWANILRRILLDLQQILIVIDTSVFAQHGKIAADEVIHIIKELKDLSENLGTVRVKVVISDRLISGTLGDSDLQNVRMVTADPRKSIHRGRRIPLQSSHVCGRTIPTRGLRFTLVEDDLTKDKEDEDSD